MTGVAGAMVVVVTVRHAWCSRGSRSHSVHVLYL